MKLKQVLFLPLFLAVSMSVCQACLWDSTTLQEEKKRHPELAKVVFGELPQPEDSKLIRDRIQKLKAEQRENEQMWWNDLAVAHIKLGELKKAAVLLESVTNRFANDYGIHANLGTAYHLMGRYQEAEREIARDLEINPDAHFGLERYHLALLKYLNKDKEYQKEHVYLEIWTKPFLGKEDVVYIAHVGRAAAGEIEMAQLESGKKDLEWEFQRTFEQDSKFEQGVAYMASLNPKEPACFVMLGIMCLAEKRDYHLAAACFQKAIDLGSPQREVLKQQILAIQKFKEESRSQRSGMVAVGSVFGLLCFGIPAIGIGYMIYRDVRWWRRSRK